MLLFCQLTTLLVSEVKEECEANKEQTKTTDAGDIHLQVMPTVRVYIALAKLEDKGGYRLSDHHQGKRVLSCVEFKAEHLSAVCVHCTIHETPAKAEEIHIEVILIAMDHYRTDQPYEADNTHVDTDRRLIRHSVHDLTHSDGSSHLADPKSTQPIQAGYQLLVLVLIRYGPRDDDGHHTSDESLRNPSPEDLWQKHEGTPGYDEPQGVADAAPELFTVLTYEHGLRDWAKTV